MKHLRLTSLGQIPEADITFGDLTVFVGEQASGKSILLQLVKLILDAGDITQTLKKHGFDWHEKTEHFLSLYFGEGMEKTWDPTATKVSVDDEAFELDKVLRLRQLLDLKASTYSRNLTEKILDEKTFKTYYFSRQDDVVRVKDISTLDAEDPDEAVSDWGGLTLFSTKSADVVTAAVSESDL